MGTRKIFLYALTVTVSIEIQQCSAIESDISEFPLPERFRKAESVFNQFNDLKSEYNPLILGDGSPDYPPPKEIQHALASAATSKDYSISQYSPEIGHPRLLKAISKLYSNLMNRTLDPNNNVLITSGATEALFVTFLSHTFPGDEWIIFEPFYEYYLPLIKATYGTPRFITLKPKIDGTNSITSADYTFDKNELSRLFNKKTKGILINTPHNPLGKVFTLDELTFIADLAKKWNTLVVCDEVYQFLTFDNSKHIRISTLPEMFARTIMIGSAGKMFGVTGYRLGWAYGDAKLLNNLKSVHSITVMAAPTPIQEAIAVVLEQEIKDFNKPHSFFEISRNKANAGRNYLYKILCDFGMNPVLPQGGFFMIANWTTINHSITFDNDKEECNDYKFAKWLIKNVNVHVIPLSSFYKNISECSGADLIRFNIIKSQKMYKNAEKLFSKKKKKWQLKQ